MNEKKKRELNALAKLFYRMQGYQADDGYDFSAAHHPSERGCWNQAVIAWVFLKKEPEMMKHQK